MSKPLKKGTKIFLAILIVAVLLGACFVSVAIYARNEFKKERSWIPPQLSPQKSSVTELPDNAHDAYEYVMRLYDEALRSDIVEAGWYTDVDLNGDVQLPFAEVDNGLVNDIRGEAVGAVKALYPDENGVTLSDERHADIPAVNLQENEILEYAYNADDIFTRKGEYRSDTYEIVFKVDPAFEDVEELLHSSVYQGICDTLKTALTVNNASLTVKEVEIRFRVDRLTDQLQSVSIYRGYDVTADVTFTDAYAALLEATGGKEATIQLPYKATEHINFMWYGLHFNEDYLEQRPDDITTLPLEIHVNSASVQGEDFTVTYDVSDPATLEIDADAVMTVKKTNDVSATDGVTVTATLQYEGKTYSDDITIYITKLEKTTTGVRFWKESADLSVGSTAPLPVEIRVPVNEQSELRTEEEYDLFVDVSDPEALSIEVDGKDLYATALRSAAAPVTVRVTLKCGGHTYEAELPVNITEGTEATTNG